MTIGGVPCIYCRQNKMEYEVSAVDLPDQGIMSFKVKCPACKREWEVQADVQFSNIRGFVLEGNENEHTVDIVNT